MPPPRPGDTGPRRPLTHLVGFPEPDVEGGLAQGLYGLWGQQVLERTAGGVSLGAETKAAHLWRAVMFSPVPSSGAPGYRLEGYILQEFWTGQTLGQESHR